MAEMSFKRQFALICWKNFVSKKRNVVRLAIEVLLPIILFLVLMFLRRIGERKMYPDCYFKPKAMPSAGDLAFYQGFYCSLNNTCENSVANSTLSIYDSSLVSEIMLAMEDAFDLGASSLKPTVNSNPQEHAQKDISNVTDNFRKYFNIVKSTFASNEELARTNLGSLLTRVTFSNDINDTQYMCGKASFPNFRYLPKFNDTGGWMNYTPTFDSNSRSDLNSTSFGMEAILKSPLLKQLDRILCGANVPSFAKQLLSLSGQTEASWQRKKEEMESQSLSTRASDLVFEEPEYENDTTKFCNSIMRSMEESLETRIVWRLFKPFIRGKIIFTPDAPVITKLMSRINDSFARPRHVLHNLLNTTGVVGLEELYILRNNEDILRRLAISDLGSDILRLIGMKSDGDPDNKKTQDQDTKSLQKLLDDIFSAYNRATSEMGNDAPWIETIKSYLDCIDWSRVIGYRSAADAEAAALALLNSERLWALVEFIDISPDAEELPPGITYKIRTGIERTHGTFQIQDRVYRPKVRRDPLIDLKHITGGWAYIQNIVESEIIREQTGRANVPGIYLQQTPYPCHIKDMFRESITRTLPMFMIVSWIFLFSMLIRRIVWEKEKRVTQTLRVMGVGKTVHWLTWFLDAFIPMFVVSFLLSTILVLGKIITYSSFIVVWIFLLAFIFPTITLAFLVSTLFSKASFAAAVAGFLFLLIYLPYPPISQFEERMDPNWKISLCLVSNIAFGLGCTWIANMEELAVGGHLSNMHISPVPGNPISMNLVIGMLFFDAFVYFLLTLYIENVFPGDDMAGRPLYYPFTVSYWFGSNVDEANSGTGPELRDSSKFEAEPNDAVPGVIVKNLFKKYGSKTALNNLSVNFYEDQITSFLGHNGAGKSTAISIMTGLSAPTAGKVLLYGQPLSNDCEIRNRNIGICSQENVLLEDLTVEEQLIFFASIKGLKDDEAKRDAEKLMTDVGILNKRSTLPKSLSGGTQRKLCVAVALIGGSKIIYLDEPTAGVDPSSRRSIWDLLVKYKKGRTVILTTHFMDEADLLSDRIAIISKGELVCCGSPVFLKSTLGSGYYLTVDCNARSDLVGRAVRGPQSDLSMLACELNNVVQSVISTAYFLEQIGSEIVFIIPLQSDIDMFGKLFSILDIQQSEGKIKSYGISDTSLEEIFLKMTTDSEIQSDLHDGEEVCSCFRIPKGYKTVTSIDPLANDAEENNSIQSPPSNFLKRNSRLFWALTIKRALHHIRNYKALVVEIVVPTVFVALAVYLSSLLPSIQSMPPLEIDISAYSPGHIFYSMDVTNDSWLNAYERELLGPTGLGTTCARTPSKCNGKPIPQLSLSEPIPPDDFTPCPCKNGLYSCPTSPSTPPWKEMSTGDRLYNLTGRNITDWIVKTELSDSYIRYGGISFGYPRTFNSLDLWDLLDIFNIKKLMSLIVPMLSRQESGGPSIPWTTKEIVNMLMSFCSEDVGKSKLKDADINDNIIIWYNNRGWIAGIGFMNAVSNLVLRASLPAGKDPTKYYIRLINHPLGITARQFQDEVDKQSNVSLLRAMVIIWALAFIPATYAVYLISERACGFKHLQIINGVGRVMYWVATFVWDFVCFALTIFIIVVIFLCYQDEAFVGWNSIGAFLCLMFAYAAVSITFVYPLSFMVKVPSSGFIAVSTINVFVGMVTLLTTFVLTIIQEDDNPFYLNTIFMIFPQFCLGKALLNMSIISITVKTMANFGVTEHPHYFEWHTTTKFIVALLSHSIIFAIATFALEFRVFQMGEDSKLAVIDSDEDGDVKEERQRVISVTQNSNHVLLLKNLTKWYNRQNRPAVNNLCLAVDGGQCFGLLGLNGAGKTTVFKMLTGSLRPSSGQAVILGKTIKSNSALRLGYCPQSDALDPFLTCEEHLAFFARLHGMQGSNIGITVQKNIDRLGLDIYRDKISKSLSGGNKRKLNTALALVGEPELILLDEPTSGMDPRARRFLWQCVQKCVLGGKCVVLTSHSMEECQTLCTRISILVNGQFRCLGTCQHLKNKYDEGYSVTVRVSTLDNLKEVQNCLKEHLRSMDHMQVNYLQMKLNLSPGANLTEVFCALDIAKNKQLIRDYSISQTTLEQIFLTLANSQDNNSLEPDSAVSCNFCRWCNKESRDVEEENSLKGNTSRCVVVQSLEN